MKDPKRLENLMKQKSESIKEKDIVKDFPSIIDDLEYITRTYRLKIKGLTEEQRINHIYDIEKYKTIFLAELMKKYMELTLNKKFSYEIDETLLFASAGGYNQEKDTVILSVVGLILNSDNLSESMKTIIHEYRHQYQFHFIHENSIESMLDYPSYFITIAKNYIPKDLNEIRDKTGFIDNIYYRNNHKRMYTETDANNYALNTIRSFLTDLYKLYPNKDSKLEAKVNSLQKELIEQSKVIEENFKKEGRQETIYLDEIYLKKPITSKLLVEGEELDSLIYVDKSIKNNPIIRDKYEVLGILMNEYTFKNYHELLFDEFRAIDKYGDKSKIKSIYDNIISSDPMLLITKLVEEKDVEGIKKFISEHPTFTEEYTEEIKELFDHEVANIEILNLLFKNDCAIMKKKGE